MPAITVSNNVNFHYTDTGPIDQSAYTTIVMLHGHSFHNGVFARILPLAKLHCFRIICVSRRGYLGSTPYTPEEKSIIDTGSAEQRSAFLNDQGVLLGLVVDGLIQKYALPEAGGIALLGWSLGNVYAMALLSAVHTLPTATKERLIKYLHMCICWDAPSIAFGMPLQEGTYFPIYDPGLTSQERVAAFKIWASGYYGHGNLSARDFSSLNQRDFDTHVRRPTVAAMSIEEIDSVFDGSAGMEYDTPIIFKGNFDGALRVQTEKALFDPDVRKEWARLKIAFMYAENTVWLIILAMWELEERAAQAGIAYEAVKDANHFLMWDEPERFMTTLKKIISASRPSNSSKL